MTLKYLAILFLLPTLLLIPIFNEADGFTRPDQMNITIGENQYQFYGDNPNRFPIPEGYDYSVFLNPYSTFDYYIIYAYTSWSFQVHPDENTINQGMYDEVLKDGDLVDKIELHLFIDEYPIRFVLNNCAVSGFISYADRVNFSLIC